MKKLIALPLFALICSLGFTSCKKDDAPASPVKQALTAHTWQMETVTNYSSGVPHITYQRGAANNEDDFSSIRQTYRSNGTILFVDDFGETGSNATYQLLDADTKIRISYAGLSIVGENLVVTASQFAYTMKFNTTDSTRFVFSPL